MASNQSLNIERLRIIANALLPIKNKIVFVGGAVVSLYADDLSKEDVRITDDIDVVVEVISRGDYSDIEEQIRSLGFKNDIDSNVICRYKFLGITVDIMPNEEGILGFSNKWYIEGVKNSIDFSLDQETSIQIFPVAYFISSKLEALKSVRHGKDYRWNSDFEDIIYIFNNCTKISESILQSDKPVKEFVKFELEKLLRRPNIEEEIIAHLEYSSQQFRKNRIISIWKHQITEI
ncbi:hypothetical protein [Emticicia fluvialis]|uniref:hypothetical protein n=1 Tax=Emticicia fluvialis TaxID=2974474 RepID=UPI0021657AC9|nr:hypothetical protein [Emticicia fluvialis]